MTQSQSDGTSLVGPSEMLTLIERGYIMIMGRTDWLTEKASRDSSDWEGALWDPDYDSVISRWASEDEFKTEKRVMLLGQSREARGYPWAEQHLGTERAERALHRYRAGELPRALLTTTKKLEQTRGVDAAVTRILRDARNHVDAFAASGATVPLEPAEHGDFAFDIVRERQEPSTRHFSVQDAETTTACLLDLLKFCATLKPPTTSKELFDSLHDGRRDELITEIGRWVDQPAPVSELHRAIQNSVSSEDFFERLRTNRGDAEFAGAVAALAVPLLTDRYRKSVLRGKKTEQTRRNFLYLTLASLGLGMYGIGDLVAPTYVYSGPTFPFLLAYGTAHPTYAQIEEMLDRLEAYLERS
jgi:hypothetical protein